MLLLLLQIGLCVTFAVGIGSSLNIIGINFQVNPHNHSSRSRNIIRIKTNVELIDKALARYYLKHSIPNNIKCLSHQRVKRVLKTYLKANRHCILDEYLILTNKESTFLLCCAFFECFQP